MATCCVANSSREGLLIDSGYTNHMTHNASLFTELDKSFYSKVRVGNVELVEVKGKGVIAVETPSGTKYISDVLFVPGISQNLLSVGQMLEKKDSLSFEDMKCTIFDPIGSEVMSITMKDKSFPDEWKPPVMHAFPCETEKSTLWHKRLGHFASATEANEVCGACQLKK